MGSVTLKRRPTVTIDPSLDHECSICGESKPRTNAYFHTRGRGANTLVNICKGCQQVRDTAQKAGKAHGKALVLVNPRPVEFDDLGTRASVGWCGDVEYFPITPLLGLTRFTSEEGLLNAIRNDPLVSDLPKRALINGLRGAPVWHLPWSHFSAFCLKFGNEQTKPQQERAQQVIEAAFGRTAESNRAAAAPVLTDDAPVVDSDLLVQVGSGLVSILQSIVENAVARRMGALPRQSEETLETVRGTAEQLRGVTAIEREIIRPVEIDRLINGTAYVFVNRAVRHPTRTDLIMISVGEVMDARSLPEVARDTLRADRYNGAKHGGTWASWRAFHTDNRKKAQDINHKLVLKAGGERERGRLDVFWVTERILENFLMYPGYLRADDIGAYAEKACLFRTPMEVYI